MSEEPARTGGTSPHPVFWGTIQFTANVRLLIETSQSQSTQVPATFSATLAETPF